MQQRVSKSQNPSPLLPSTHHPATPTTKRREGGRERERGFDFLCPLFFLPPPSSTPVDIPDPGHTSFKEGREGGKRRRKQDKKKTFFLFCPTPFPTANGGAKRRSEAGGRAESAPGRPRGWRRGEGWAERVACCPTALLKGVPPPLPAWMEGEKKGG